jgi:hypothetical protein
MASWGNLEKACRVARQKFPGNNNVQRVFREGLRYLKVMYHHVPYSFLKLMIHYHNSFTDIQEIGVDQWLECIIECQAQWVTLSTSQGISSYDSDRRDRQLQVYRERATVPELKTIYEKETWETVNRHNGAIRLVKAWALLPAIQAYTDQFSDPDEMNEVDKGKLITAFRTLSHVVGEVMNKRSGAPDAKDLAPKIVFWELFKMLLPTCVSGDGNALDDLDHSAIKTANAILCIGDYRDDDNHCIYARTPLNWLKTVSVAELSRCHTAPVLIDLFDRANLQAPINPGLNSSIK